MSRGSSPTSSVRTTAPTGPLEASSTTLTLSDRWLTTQTSVSLRAATATGSSPTGIEARWVRPLDVDLEDLEAVVRRVDGEEAAPAGGERERPDLAALEEGVLLGGGLGSYPPAGEQ